VIGGGAVVIVAAIILATGKEPPPAKPAPVATAPDIGWNHERVKDVRKWAAAVAADDRIALAITTDLDAFQRRFGLGENRMVSTMSGDERTKLKDEILEALATHEDTKVLREFEPYDGRLVDASMADASAGRVSLAVSARPEARERYASPDAVIELSFTTRDGKTLVDGFSVTSPPRPKVERPVRQRTKHDKIAKPQAREVEVGGRKVKVFEAEIVPLDHLPDTPPELREEIDRLVNELIRTDSDFLPRHRTKVKNRLAEIGKPAVPRLLTRFNDIKADTPDGIAKLTQIDALLRDMSGQAFGFSPAHNTVLISPEQNEQARTSALKQWYAWWYYYHDKPLDAAFDKEEEDFLQPAKKLKGDK